MKYKNLKKVVMVAFFIALTGILFTGCGIRYIVNGNGTNALKKEDAKVLTVEKEIVEPITRINIHTSMADVKIIPAEDYYVQIDFLYWDEAPEYTLTDGVLRFDDSDAFPKSYSINFNLNNSVKIYVPKEALFDHVLINNSSGDLSLEGFMTDELDLNVSYGDLTLRNVAASDSDIRLSSGNSKISDFSTGKMKYNNSYGNAKFTNINIEELQLPGNVSFDSFKVTMSSGKININSLNCNSIDISNSYGNVTCDEVTAKEFEVTLSSGNLDVSKADIEKIDVRNSYGNVTLSLAGKKEDYTMDLNTSYGKIKVAGKGYEDHLVIENNGTRNIEAELSSGDIGISFYN